MGRRMAGVLDRHSNAKFNNQSESNEGKAPIQQQQQSTERNNQPNEGMKQQEPTIDPAARSNRQQSTTQHAGMERNHGQRQRHRQRPIFVHSFRCFQCCGVDFMTVSMVRSNGDGWIQSYGRGRIVVTNPKVVAHPLSSASQTCPWAGRTLGAGLGMEGGGLRALGRHL